MFGKKKDKRKHSAGDDLVALEDGSRREIAHGDGSPQATAEQGSPSGPTVGSGIGDWLDKKLYDAGDQDVTIGWADCMLSVPLRVDPAITEPWFAAADSRLAARAGKLDFLSPQAAESSMKVIASIYAEAWQGARADLVAAEETSLEKIRRLNGSWSGNMSDVEGELKVVRDAIKEMSSGEDYGTGKGDGNDLE